MAIAVLGLGFGACSSDVGNGASQATSTTTSTTASTATSTAASTVATAVSRADPAVTALASAVDVHAMGCRTVDVRGAGSLIDGNHILTAAHVVSGADSITVRSAAAGAATVAAHLVAIDAVHDLALLDVDLSHLTELRPVALADGGAAEAGDAGVAVLFRDDAAIVVPYTIAKPVVVRILDIHHENKVSRPGYAVDIEIAAGDSGAVMVADDGRAVGVLYAKSREAESRAFASDTSAVTALLTAAAAADPAVGIDTGECV